MENAIVTGIGSVRRSTLPTLPAFRLRAEASVSSSVRSFDDTPSVFAPTPTFDPTQDVTPVRIT